MSSSALRRKKLLIALRDKVLPWAQSASFLEHFLFAQPPFDFVPDGVGVTTHAGKPLRLTPKKRLAVQLQQWPEHGVHASRFPYMGVVVEGEIDWRIGVTQETARRDPKSLGQCDYQVLSMPAGTFFLIPPCVPYSVSGVHWERPHPEKAHSQVFWLQVLSAGALCHSCSTHNGVHDGNKILFLYDAQLSIASEILLKELNLRLPGYEQIVQLQIITLLTWALRALDTTRSLDVSGDLENLDNSQMSEDIHSASFSNAALVKRACAFIDSNLGSDLTIDAIADHVYSSRTHINRLFRTELGLSVMQFVVVRRIEIAKSLLSTTHMSVRDVGQQIGYPNPSYFSRFFYQHVQATPKEFRGGFMTEW